MNTLSAWLHQHDFLLLVGIAFAGSAIVLARRRPWTHRALAVWSNLLVLAAVSFIALRTPAASVTEYRDDPLLSNSSMSAETAQSTALTYEELTLPSVDAIEQFILHSSKPTLVEFYSDYGIG